MALRAGLKGGWKPLLPSCSVIRLAAPRYVPEWVPFAAGIQDPGTRTRQRDRDTPRFLSA